MEDKGIAGDVLKEYFLKLLDKEPPEVFATAQYPCEHDWHYYGTYNGVPEWYCQTCGAKKD